MFLKFVLNKWLESLTFFKWNNLSLLFLASLNAFKRSFLIILKYFWWFGLFLFAFDYVIESFFAMDPFESFLSVSLLILRYLFFMLFSFFAFMVVRASVERKDFRYFIKYIHRIGGFLLIPFFIYAVGLSALYLITYIWGGGDYLQSLPYSMYDSWFLTIVLFILLSLTFATAVFSSYFFFDFSNGLSSVFLSIKNGCKFIFYFFPISFIFGAISTAALILFMRPLELEFWSIVMYFSYYIGIILYLSISSIIYFKIKHSNYSLFFKPKFMD
ncbi:MAG: hypothetical protein ABIA74_00910 [bacterium]